MNRLKIYGCNGVQDTVGIGTTGFDWTTHDVLYKYLPDAAGYFLYTYIPESEKYDYPKLVREKREKQLEVREWITGIFCPNYGSEEDLDMIIRGNIVNAFNGKTTDSKYSLNVSSVEDVLEKMKQGEIEPVSGVFLTLLSLLIPLILGVIELVLNYFSTKYEIDAQKEAQAAYVVPTEETIKESVFGAEDFEDWNGTTETAGASKWLPLLLLPTAAFMLLKKQKNK